MLQQAQPPQRRSWAQNIYGGAAQASKWLGRGATAAAFIPGGQVAAPWLAGGAAAAAGVEGIAGMAGGAPKGQGGWSSAGGVVGAA